MCKLRAILFVSSARQRLSEPELSQLMQKTQLQHAADGITGVLLHSDGSFMQYLEGPEQAVEIAYQRISQGAEQTGCITLSDIPLAQRMFSVWEMAFAQPTQSELLARSTAAWKAQSDALRQKLQLVPELAVLQSFWDNAHRGGF